MLNPGCAGCAFVGTFSPFNDVIIGPDGYGWVVGGGYLGRAGFSASGNTYTYLLAGYNAGGGSITITDLGATPEPSSLLLFAVGLAALIVVYRRGNHRLL